jgi:hypothetical protein
LISPTSNPFSNNSCDDRAVPSKRRDARHTLLVESRLKGWAENPAGNNYRSLLGLPLITSAAPPLLERRAFWRLHE